MKKSNKNITSLLLKSFTKEIKPFPLIFILAIISLLFIGGYKTYRNCTDEKNLNNAQELYGRYNLIVNDLNIDEANKIEKSCLNYETITVYQTKPNLLNGLMIYGTRDYFDMSNMEILQGKIPKGVNQIMCEEKYLTQQGIEFSESKDTYIEIDGTMYLITGTICVNDNIHIEGYYLPRFFLDYNSLSARKSDNNYSLYIATDTQENAFELKKSLLRKNNIDENDILFNNSVLIYTGTIEDGSSSDIVISICDKLFYLILFLLVIVFISVISMRYKKMKSTTRIYTKLGISDKTLLWVISLFMIIFFFMSITISCAILISILFFIKSNITVILEPLLFMIVFSIFSVISAIFVFSKNIKNEFIVKNKISTLKKAKNTDEYNSQLINTKHPFFRIAQINVNTSKKRYVLSLVGTVMTIVILSLFLYSTNYINIDQGEYQYDYRVDYVYDSMAESYIGSEEIYNKYTELLSSRLFDVFPVYYKNHSIKINKNSMDKDFIKFLRTSNTEAFMELEHIDNKLFSTRFVVIGADENLQKKIYGLSKPISLKDNECILVNYVNTPNGKGFSTGLSMNDILTISYYDYSTVEGGVEADFNLSIKCVVDEINFNFQDSFYHPIIIVNKNVFNKISTFEYDYPQLLYLNTKSDSKEDINNFFKGISGMLLTDLTEIKNMITEQKIASSASIFVMCLLLVFILSTNSAINIINKYNYERKQLATLKAIGIENKYLIFNLAYEYIITIIQSILFGSILSFIACYIVYFYIRDKAFYFVFEIPIIQIIIPILLVLIIYILSAIPIYKKISKMNISETLQTE